ncbi:DNA-binding transcriptional LysR family regulator [Stackebrandtia endophytica]|uniref:DNA-binding transcriptional LysR family regulator n=1 Tax=Stackebrandtia endophytica TaxID=1496996 RepID=A0A543ARG2_9ACTN|nr:LysR family transcriptional regulator [Stackebrandtia endophytica]TQL75178.1 DNA-binding transcriptional LysR family regulator [Stackebrandtia endophytica]
MDVRQLEYFLAVVDEGGINRAARALYLAQPSLSQAIRNLERDLGQRLFERLGRGLVLTEAGQALVEPARQVVRGLDTARAAVESVGALVSGTLSIASMPSPAVEPLSSLISDFLGKFPDVRVTVKDAPVPTSVIDMVNSGVTELGLFSSWDKPAVADVRLYPLERQRFVLVAPPDGRFVTGEPVRWEQLAGVRLIVGEHGTGIRRLVEEIRAVPVPVTIAVETEHREAVLPLVLNGVGVGVLAEAWRPLATRAGAVVCDLDPAAGLQLFLACRNGWLSPAAAEFLAVARTGE